MDKITVANAVGGILIRAGVHETAVQHVWDRLVDGFADDTGQELTALYAMLRPEDNQFIFIRDGKVSSPKEPGAVAYRRV